MKAGEAPFVRRSYEVHVLRDGVQVAIATFTIDRELQTRWTIQGADGRGIPLSTGVTVETLEAITAFIGRRALPTGAEWYFAPEVAASDHFVNVRAIPITSFAREEQK